VAATIDTRALLGRLIAGGDLSAAEAHDLMTAVMTGEVPAGRLAGILAVLRAKGESVDEIVGFARAMRESAVSIRTAASGLLDTCGTGGDGAGTFNISTATALVAAAMGIPVAKHGNRAVSSKCGSADVLEALGVNLDVTPAQAGTLVDEVGIGFLFAPYLHPAMKHAMPARRELGVRTVFNVLGPLTNPAGADRQLLGVFAPDLCEPLARVLGELGSARAFVVHGAGGLDEVSLLGPTTVAEWDGSRVRTFTFEPAEAGLETCLAEDLAGGSAAVNAAIIRTVLAGEPGPCTDAVLINAGFAAVAAGRAEEVRAGVDLARTTLQAGRGTELLERFRTASHQGAVA
jgi:anthranilate phosphoribosyltransferase